ACMTGRQEVPGKSCRKQKGPARGDGRGLKSFAEATDLFQSATGAISLEYWLRRPEATNAKWERLPCTRRSLGSAVTISTEQKKRLHPKMEPLIGSKSKSKVVANGRGRRKRHLPGGSQSREEDSTLIRVSQSRTEGGGYGAAHIDSHNMD